MKKVNVIKRFFHNNLLLITIIFIGLFFRLYGLNWDQGFHLHPDERAITLFSLPLALPNNISDFFLTTSPLNPHFFAYGSFPIYLLKAVSFLVGNFNPIITQYAKLNLLGRHLSVFFDISTVILLYSLAKKLFNEKIGLIAAFFYSASVLPIQSSHFYITDIPLTFFTLFTLYTLIIFYEKPSILKSSLIGLFFGLSLATKTSASVLIASIGITLAVDFLLIFFRNLHRPRIWFPHLPKFIKNLIIYGIIIFTTTGITFLVFEPYALIDFHSFLQQTQEQREMTYNPFIFPYTLQYVGKTPYLYELKNLFLWGQGPILSLFSIIGAFYFTYLAFKKDKKDRWAKEAILATFFWMYFLVVGSFAIGFMRYLLPVYPLLCLFAATIFFQLNNLLTKKLKPQLSLILNSLFLILFIIWPVSFLNIYNQPNTRVMASNWINNNIPPGKTLAVEHWDDSLPLFGQEKYQTLTLNLYDYDSPQKWTSINQKLNQTDYIIIASNRLYVPLQKLTDCNNLPPFHCYPTTANYYKNLFSGKSNFQKIAEFSVYPAIPFFNIPINDQSADESFTVYDHPKVLIFERSEKRTQ